MERNVGTVDRAIRGIVGIALVLVFFLAPPANVYLYYGALIVGVVLLGTALIGWCPPYAIFGIKTCGSKSSNPESS